MTVITLVWLDSSWAFLTDYSQSKYSSNGSLALEVHPNNMSVLEKVQRFPPPAAPSSLPSAITKLNFIVSLCCMDIEGIFLRVQID